MAFFHKLCLAVLATVFLVSCVKPDDRASVVNRRQLVKTYQSLPPIDRTFIERMSSSIKLARDYYANKTILSYSTSHGTQVEFHDRAGRSYLWYPRNTHVVVGEWRVEARENGAYMCYRYGPETFNPATGQPGGGWSCAHLRARLTAHVERMQGNPFALRRGQVPYGLEFPQLVTASDIAQRLGTKARLTYLKTPRSR